MTRARQRSPEEKAFELAKVRDVGERLRSVMQEEPVKKFFETTQLNLVSQITAAAGGDGELLRIAGLKLQVFLQFKQALMAAAGQGEAAQEKLARMNSDVA